MKVANDPKHPAYNAYIEDSRESAGIHNHKVQQPTIWQITKRNLKWNHTKQYDEKC